MRNNLVFSLILITSAAFAQNVKVLQDFETDADLKIWEFKKKSAVLSDKNVTHGKKSLQISANEYMVSFRFEKNWSAYDALEIDIFNTGKDPVAGSLLIGDADFMKKNSYWNRHNGTFTLKPGANTLSLPVNGLFRGEAGSRGHDLKTNIDPAQIARLDIGFQTKEESVNLFMDYVRLVKESRPDGILAFDFGPESQSIFPGFAAITWNTVHGKNGAAAGLRHPKWGPNAARDDTFPTRLFQDAVQMQDDEFIATVPNGNYSVWLVFSDLGYWGGEQAFFRKRWIESDGKQVWSEDRGEAGPTDYLYRFEKVEPMPGDSIWDLYMKPLVEPKRFEVEVADGTLNLRFRADGWNACRVAGLVLYPLTKKAESEKWLAEVEAKNRSEFEKRAVYMGKPKQAFGIIGFPSLEDEILPDGEPGPAEGKLARTGARGQRLSYTFAVRPKKDQEGEVRVSVTDLTGPAGSIPAANIETRYVHYATHRGYNDIAYTIQPESLRKLPGSLRMQANVTRQFWLTVKVPADAKPGTYSGQITLSAWLDEKKIPISLEVLDLSLDEPDFRMGFYGTHIPSQFSKEQRTEAMRKLFMLIKDYGMNCLSGGPNIPFSGFDADGKPKLDFAACDEYFRIARECGFTKEFVSYGGPAMIQGLHDGYKVGNTGREWEKKTGKPLGELLKIVWGAVKEHAEKENWPPVLYGMTDEPRVIEHAKAELELMKIYREAVPFVRIGGSYSVHWKDDPFENVVQEIFKTLTWSALNLHTQTDVDKAKEFGRELWIYNQGRSRFSFGAYQWAESRKGVRGRLQWHLLCLHGCQFFDLDGREPDTAMINWGRDEIIPTIHFARAREGADDLRFAVTLWNLAQKKKDSPEAQAALAWLEDVNQKIGVQVRERPAGFMDDETFRNTCIQHIKKLQGK
ncbi:MAG TPA: glycoside hydrolase domain-containing protein [Planctomycetota bacterium]|nr:glycoside hydrolase domain-containing protein [Planctomycetota bacterium]